MDTLQLEERIQHLEEQNARILSLLEQLADSSFRYHGKKLPEEKPDFARIEAELRAALSDPETAALTTLESFEAKEWLCEVILLHKTDSSQDHERWDKVTNVVKTVSAACGVPGRVAGWHPDPADRRTTIGDVLQFGYSPEVGYDHPNEF